MENNTTNTTVNAEANAKTAVEKPGFFARTFTAANAVKVGKVLGSVAVIATLGYIAYRVSPEAVVETTAATVETVAELV